MRQPSESRCPAASELAIVEVAGILGCVFANSSLIAYRSTSLPNVIERTLGPNAFREHLGSSFDESARLEVGDTNIERRT
jgi:hypothetical protein